MDIINPQALGAPRGYSNGILAPTSSRMLFIAGQIAWNSQQIVVSDEFAEQFAQTLDNVLAVVAAAGGKPHHLAQLTLYVTDKTEYIAELKSVGEIYRSRMGKHFPTMAMVEVRGLLEPRAKVEIQGVAAIPGEVQEPGKAEEEGEA